MSDQMYLVTGSMGHLGNTIVQKLLAQGCRVRGLALPQDQSLDLADEKFELVRGDVRRPDSLKPFFYGLEERDVTLIHTAGIVSIASRFQQDVYDVNVMGTRNLLELSKQYNIRRFVYVSTVHAIPANNQTGIISETNQFDPGNVEGLYAKTKAEASRLVMDSVREGLDAAIVHPSGIIGPGDYGRGHLTQLVLDFVDGRLTACVRGGYDFVDVRDVADGTIACARSGRKGSAYILSNRYCEICDVLDMLHDITGRKKIGCVLPAWFAKMTAPMAETYYKIRRQPPLYTPYSLSTLKSNGMFSHDRATKELNYQPRAIRDTLLDTVIWLAGHNRFKKPLFLPSA